MLQVHANPRPRAEPPAHRIDEWRLSAAAVTERLLFACAGRCRARGVRFAVADVRGDPTSVALLGRLEAASIPVLRIAPDYAAPHMAFVGEMQNGFYPPGHLAAGLRERVLR